MIPYIENKLRLTGSDGLYSQLEQEFGEHIRHIPLIVSPVLEQNIRIITSGLQFPDTISVFTDHLEDSPDRVELSASSVPSGYSSSFDLEFLLVRLGSEITHASLPEVTIQRSIGIEQHKALQHSGNDEYIYQDSPAVTVASNFELAKDALPLPNIFLVHAGNAIYLTNLHTAKPPEQLKPQPPRDDRPASSFTPSRVLYRAQEPTSTQQYHAKKEATAEEINIRMRQKLHELDHGGNTGRKKSREAKFLRRELKKKNRGKTRSGRRNY